MGKFKEKGQDEERRKGERKERTGSQQPDWTSSSSHLIGGYDAMTMLPALPAAIASDCIIIDRIMDRQIDKIKGPAPPTQPTFISPAQGANT